jgi:hypothetical protein
MAANLAAGGGAGERQPQVDTRLKRTTTIYRITNGAACRTDANPVHTAFLADFETEVEAFAEIARLCDVVYLQGQGGSQAHYWSAYHKGKYIFPSYKKNVVPPALPTVQAEIVGARWATGWTDRHETVAPRQQYLLVIDDHDDARAQRHFPWGDKYVRPAAAVGGAAPAAPAAGRQ